MVSALGLFATDAVASPILWTLGTLTVSNGAVFGTLTGSFVFDADTGTYSDVAITSTLPNASFDTSDVGGAFMNNSGGLQVVTNFGLPDLTNQLTVWLSFPALSNAGGNVSVGGFSGRCFISDSLCSGILFIDGGVTLGGSIAGSLTGTRWRCRCPSRRRCSSWVPGLLGAGVRRWRQRRA